MELYESLKNFPILRLQYLFYNCFIISSKEMNTLYESAKGQQIKKLNDVEIYYSPDYLYEKYPNNSAFERINSQNEKKFYFLKEHIFYYQYLLLLTESKEKGDIKTEQINEISYRTLMNRLYLLHDYPNENNEHYGISYIFNAPCIYTVIEPNIVKQIINMKKFSFELLDIQENEVMNLFGINKDIENQSFIYNNSLISISLSNSTINEEKNLDELDMDENVNKRNKDILQKEKFLINLSSELFLFDYITKQFDKSKLKQLPRMIFFCCVFDENMKDIYKLRKEKIEKKLNNLGNLERKEEIKQKKKVELNKEKNKGEGKLNEIGQKIENDIKIENNITINQDNNFAAHKKGKKENIDKNLLKCQLLDFCGTLELDGAFKYLGENIDLKSDSLVIILSEFLNDTNNIEKYIEKNEENIIINKIKKNQSNIDQLKKTLSKFKMFKNIEITKEIIEKVKKELEDKPKIIFDKKITIKSNDIVLIESKREFPKNLLDEIRNFIEHSFYFITLYKNKNILENSSIIHLIFVYDHTRNYEDENRAYSGLNDIIKDNYEKLNIINNKIKFYLVHSLPNLNLSILDKLENNISDLNKKNNDFTNLMIEQNNQINNLKSQNKNLTNLMEKQNSQIINLTSQNELLKENIEKLMKRIDELEEKIGKGNNNNNKKNEDINNNKHDKK